MTKDDEKESKAVALEYNKDNDLAPRITATGSGHIAEQLLKIAEENDIPIHKDASLVEILAALEIDSFIPLEAYSAVAEILNYIYSKNAQKP